MGPDLTDSLALVGGLAILALVVGFLLFTALWVLKLLYGIATKRPSLAPFARTVLVAGRPARLEYAPPNGTSHALWVEIEAKWKGSDAWNVDVALRLSGAIPPIEVRFPIGEDDEENDIRSPHAGYGLTAVSWSRVKLLSRQRVRTTVKLYPVPTTVPGSTVAVEVLVAPATCFDELRAVLMAATDPPSP